MSTQRLSFPKTLNQISETSDKSFPLTRDSWSIDIELVIDFVS